MGTVLLYRILVYLIDMPRDVKTRRAYRSPRRTEQARATRQAIRDAAARLFVEHGYAATRITEIARAADVAPETVYAAFKNKPTLLKECIDVAIAGDDEPIPVADRPWLDDVRNEDDAQQRTRMLSNDGFARGARVAPIMEVLRSAAASDSDLAALWVEMQEARHQQIELYADIVNERDPSNPFDREVIDLVWAISGPELYTSLVGERGWSLERYVAVLGDVVEAMAKQSAP